MMNVCVGAFFVVCCFFFFFKDSETLEFKSSLVASEGLVTKPSWQAGFGCFPLVSPKNLLVGGGCPQKRAFSGVAVRSF